MSTSDKSCNIGASKSNNDDSVCEVNDKLQNMRTADNISLCANCGKEGDDVNNICNKCKKAKYCNATCKKKHKKKHKKDCERHIKLAAEHAAKLHDEKLFKQPPPLDDCPICFLRMPTIETGYRYMACCGKMICSGCFHAPVFDNQGNEVDSKKCPFCRIPTPSSQEEGIERIKIRVELDDPIAIYNLGCDYVHGTNGYPQNHTKALKLFRRAAELEHASSYNSIAYAYDNGRGVEIDKKKAKYYYELAAIKGDVWARYNLGNNERRAGNMNRSIKHYMIAVKCGYDGSLDRIKQFYTEGYATKEDYTKALKVHQEYLGEIKSDQRDKAAAAREDYRYY